MARRSSHQIMKIAFHEAGHAIALVVQGQVVNRASIVPEKGSLGRVWHPSVYHYFVGTAREQRAIARELILVSYAGWAAEVRFDPTAEELGNDSDNEAAFDLSRDYGLFPRRIEFVGDDYHHEYLDRLRKESARLIRKHWQAVVRVGEELYKRKRLAGDVVEKMVNG